MRKTLLKATAILACLLLQAAGLAYAVTSFVAMYGTAKSNGSMATLIASTAIFLVCYLGLCAVTDCFMLKRNCNTEQ